MLNIPVSKLVLNESRVCPLIGQGKTASMTKHMWMGGKRKSGLFTVIADRKPSRFPA
jgi:hypothetical protein